MAALLLLIMGTEVGQIWIIVLLRYTHAQTKMGMAMEED